MTESGWLAKIVAYVRESIEEPWEGVSIRADCDEYGINTLVRYRTVGGGSEDEQPGYVDGLAQAFYELGAAHRPKVLFSTCYFTIDSDGHASVTFEYE